MKKLLLIATLSIFTAFTLTACSEQDIDKAVQKVGDVIEDNKISQEQLDSAEDTFNNVKDKTSEIVNEAKEAIMEEVEESTEAATEEETTVDSEDSSASAGNKGSENVEFAVSKATRVRAGNGGDENHDVTFANGNDAIARSAVADVNEFAEPTVLASTKDDFRTRDLFYITNCIEDVEAYADIVRESRSGEHSGNVGIDIEKIVANDAYLKALSVLSKIDFEDISVSSKLVNKYEVSEEEFTKALIEILSNM